MKTILLVFAFLTNSWLQPNFSAVISAIKQGNVTALSAYFDQAVELTLANEEGSFGKEQAIQKVTQFLSQNKPSDCTMVHNGAARDNSSYYCIGSLTAGAKKYRLNIFFGNKNGQYLIQEMRFEED